MATTSISVNKKSVKDFLRDDINHLFLIPKYQRPYAWTDEQAKTLFDDLLEFTETNIDDENGKNTYFLGSIVFFENENDEQEIIDGQQRITSLFLLLRAIYTKLSSMPTKTKQAENFMNEIRPLIWKKDKFTGDFDFSKILIKSKVMNNEGNEILRKILETGIADKKASDNYSKNYLLFQDLFDNLSLEKPMLIYYFILYILERSIVLPIQADTQDTALTIFSTLNDRGLPLSDADIFKAKIYNHLNEKEKQKFISDWQDLDERAQSANESIQQLFYYYMYYLRALEKDNSTTTPGLRKYYSQNNFERLYTPNIMQQLDNILNLWVVINRKECIDDELWSFNKKITTILDILSSYNNEFWKYPVIIYYLSHHNEQNFECNFLAFLRKLCVVLCTKYVVTPTVNAVKNDIIKLNIAIVNSALPNFTFKEISTQDLKNGLKLPHRNIVRMLLKLLAYTQQDNLLPDKWEIEHILPKNYQKTYFSDVSDKMIKTTIEHIGNKTPFEKKLNIQASDNYFNKKKKIYKSSTIKVTQKLSNIPISNWKLEEIYARDAEIIFTLTSLFEKWNTEYTNLTH